MTRSTGWDRRMAATRRRIVEVALDLFEQHGFERVTMVDIAGAAGVGERTVYRYFSAKEAIVLEDEPDAFGAFVDGLHATPPGLPAVDAVRQVYRSFAPPPEEVGLESRRSTLVQATPALLRAWAAMLADLEPRLRGWLALRTGRDPGDDEIAVATAALLAVHRLLVESWDGADIDAYLDRADRALDLLARGLRTLDEPPDAVSGG